MSLLDTDADRPRAVEGLEIRAAGDETLVHDPGTAHVHVLNATAGLVLELCDGTRDRAAIAAALRERVADAPAGDALEADVAAVLDRFVELQLVKP